MPKHKSKKAEVLRATTPQDIWFAFNTLAESITQELNRYAYQQSDPEVARLYVTFWQSIATFCKLAKKYLPDSPVLPDLPTLIENDYYAGLVHLKDYCAEVAKRTSSRLQPLSGNAQIVYGILNELPPHKALIVPEILDAVSERHGKQWDEKELYDRVFPQLRPYGLKNKRRYGYWLEK